MNKIIFIILSIILLTSCSSNNLSKNLNIQSAQLAHQKLLERGLTLGRERKA